jgi:hypothetical protein
MQASQQTAYRAFATSACIAEATAVIAGHRLATQIEATLQVVSYLLQQSAVADLATELTAKMTTAQNATTQGTRAVAIGCHDAVTAISRRVAVTCSSNVAGVDNRRGPG